MQSYDVKAMRRVLNKLQEVNDAITNLLPAEEQPDPEVRQAFLFSLAIDMRDELRAQSTNPTRLPSDLPA